MSSVNQTIASPVRPSGAFMLRHPAHLLALGFGSGLSPVAPGTVGTLLGWLMFNVLALRVPHFLAPPVLLTVIGVSFLVGVVACHVTGRGLGVQDHGAIVWDEIVAIWLVLAVAPTGWSWQCAGVVLFRVFDIWKPAPIGRLELRFKNGFGTMADDMVAAAYALLVLAIIRSLTA
ncbi:MAG TPA: phosphatidylglycerophosphatase A [Burkholderiaceae bacterium]|nr:phosphatidylglycerophosphatase A [Burkholderiaceae bacterium]